MRLYVNVDHVATVREARGTDEPDPVHAALLAELGGADGITVHLREDRRHIQERDVRLLGQSVRSGVNLELAVDDEVVAIACEIQPMQATVVPERREEVTTEGGLNLVDPATRAAVQSAVERIKSAGIRVSAFVDPDRASIETAAAIGVDAVELHTGEYANARGVEARTAELSRILLAAQVGRALELAVHAGHGLTYQNVTPVAALPEIEELNIGHSIVARAILVGMDSAVREMKEVILAAPHRVSEPGRWTPPIGY